MNKYLLRYPSETVSRPLLSEVILETKTPVNILMADVDYREGIIVITVIGSEKQEKRVLDALRKKGVIVEKLEKRITKDKDKCIDCGVCVGICPTNAIAMDDLTVEIDNEKCVYCEVCINACPVKAISIMGK